MITVSPFLKFLAANTPLPLIFESFTIMFIVIIAPGGFELAPTAIG